MATISALDFLRRSEDLLSIPPFCVVFGEEAFLRFEAIQRLRSLVLSETDAEFSFTRFDGNSASFMDVLRETSTMVMFGSGKRLVLVEQADSFVSQNKERLEDYLDEPGSAGILVLQLGSFPSNLRLYKKANEKGLLVDCKPPTRKDSITWLMERSSRNQGVSFARDAVETLIELFGDDLGALDQEMRRLALLSGGLGKKIDVAFVQNNVSELRQKKVWDLVDAALSGRTAEALRQLNKLIDSGEAPIAILAQISATVRKLSAATQLFLEADPSKPKLNVSTALDMVGVKPFVKTKALEQLKQVGSKRGQKLSELLLQTDLELKGASRMDPRFALERFIAQISCSELRSQGFDR